MWNFSDYVVISQDKNVLDMKKIDLRHVQFESFLKKQSECISTKTQIERLCATAYFPLDARIAQSLILQKGQAGLEWFYVERGVCIFSCLGTMFKREDSSNDEYVLLIERRRTGGWTCELQELNRKWLGIVPAAVL